MRAIFTICLIFGFHSNYSFAADVPLPKFQEAIAAYVENAVNNSKSVSELYESFEKGYVSSKNKATLEELKSESKQIASPMVVRDGRVLTIQIKDQKVKLEIVDALNQKFVIDGREVDLLKYSTLADKHKYLYRLFNLNKSTSLQKSIFYFLFSAKEASAGTVANSVAGTAGGAAVGAVVCLITAPACIAAVAVGGILGTVGAGLWNVCVTFQMSDKCTKNEVIVGSTIGQIGQEIEKSMEGTPSTVSISCPNLKIRILKADKSEIEYKDPTSPMITSLKRGCAANRKLFETSFMAYAEKRNRQVNPDNATTDVLKVDITR